MRKYHVGANVPGYLPETDAQCHDNASEAIDALASMIDSDLDATEPGEWPDEDFARAMVEGLSARGETHYDATFGIDTYGYHLTVDTGRALPTVYWVEAVDGDHTECEGEE